MRKDCMECCRYQVTCDGKEKYFEVVSARGFIRCKNKRENLTEAEIEEIMRR